MVGGLKSGQSSSVVTDQSGLSTYILGCIRTTCLKRQPIFFFIFFSLQTDSFWPTLSANRPVDSPFIMESSCFEPSFLSLCSETCQLYFVFTHCSVKYGMTGTAEVLNPSLWPYLHKKEIWILTSGFEARLSRKYVCVILHKEWLQWYNALDLWVIWSFNNM